MEIKQSFLLRLSDICQQAHMDKRQANILKAFVRGNEAYNRLHEVFRGKKRLEATSLKLVSIKAAHKT